MTQLLIHLFVRHPDDTKNAAVRTAYGNLASLVGMACNLLLCLGKLAAGTLFGARRTRSIPTAMPGMSIWRASWSASPSSPSGFRC